MHHRAGDAGRATALLEQARAAAAPGVERATVLAQLWPASRRARATPSRSTARRSRTLTGDDALQATIHLSLAGLMRFTEGIERGMEHGERAVRAASRVGDAALRCRALAAYGLMHFNAGRGLPTRPMDEALALERSLAAWPLDRRPTWSLRMAALLVSGRRPRAGPLPGGPACRRGAERPRGRGRGAVVPEPARVAGGELGARRTGYATDSLDLVDAARPR